MICRVFFFVLCSFNAIFAQNLCGESDFVSRGLKKSFEKPGWIACAGLVAASTLLDKKVQTWHGKLLPEPASVVFDAYGQGVNYVMGSGFVYVNTLHNGNNKEFPRMRNLFYAAMVNAFLTAGIKYSVRRQRPNKQSRLAFPSGHTSSSFVVAASLHEFYGPRVGVPAYILATLTGLQRIHDNKHWLSDVLGGALLGTLIGRGFSQIEEKGRQKTITIGYQWVF